MSLANHRNHTYDKGRCLITTFTSLGLATASALLSSNDTVAVAQTTIPAGGKAIFVNSTIGSDTTGNGNQSAPLKTITRALAVAGPSSVIVLAPGTYSATSGETFPLILKPGVSIQGEPASKGHGVVILGGGGFLSPTFARQNITILGANQARLDGVTVTNPNPRGYGLWIESSSPMVVDNTFTGNNHDGISMTGESNPIIRRNYFYQNGANGITIYGSSRPEIQENLFEKTGYGINIAEHAAPWLIGNRLEKNRSGIVAEADSHPLLRGNVIEDNTEDGLVAISNSQPDLGTPTEPGGNVFRHNGAYDIDSRTAVAVISAFGNLLNSNRTIGKVNLARTSTPVATETRLSPQPKLVANPPTIKTSLPNISISLLPPHRLVSHQVKPIHHSKVVARKRWLKPKSTFPFFPARSLTPVTPVLADSVSPPAFEQQQQQTRTLVMAPVIIHVPPPEVQANSTASRLSAAAPQENLFSNSAVGGLPQGNSTAIVINVPPPENPIALNQPDTQVEENLFQNPAADSPQDNSTQSAIQPSEGTEIYNPPTASNQLLPPLQSLPILKPASVAGSELLPVPHASIPLGHGNKQPKTVLPPNLIAASTTAPDIPPLRTAALNGQYRVIVEAASASTQAKVRSLFPEAFPILLNGRVVMQTGVFSDRANAWEMMHLLSSKGLKATLEPMN